MDGEGCGRRGIGTVCCNTGTSPQVGWILDPNYWTPDAWCWMRPRRSAEGASPGAQGKKRISRNKLGLVRMEKNTRLSLYGILTFWCRLCTDSVYFWFTSSFKQRVNFEHVFESRYLRKFRMVQETISPWFAGIPFYSVDGAVCVVHFASPLCLQHFHRGWEVSLWLWCLGWLRRAQETQ